MVFKITNKTKNTRKVWNKTLGRFIFVNSLDSVEVLIPPKQEDIWKIEEIKEKKKKQHKDLERSEEYKK